MYCYKNGDSDVEVLFSDLIPNELFGLYGVWSTKDPGTHQTTFTAVAFGGFPSYVVSSADGKAIFKRKLNYCPKNVTPDGSILMFISVAFHFNGISNGPFPFSTQLKEKYRDKDGTIFLG